MKRTFKLSTGVFGEGDPKICAPIVGRTKEDVFKAAEIIAKTEADVVEWRGDWFDRVEDRDELLEVLQGIRGRIREKALLFTLRTVYEGGQLAVMKDTYYELNERAARSGYVDLVDVEAFREEERTSEEIRKLQSAGVHVIASFHNFDRTPDREELIRRLTRIQEMGADVAKIAVMPQSREDVMTLMEATMEADHSLDIPVVTMSMGRMGVLSRLAGTLTGSAMTFASVGEASAPGQIPIEQMRVFCQLLSMK